MDTPQLNSFATTLRDVIEGNGDFSIINEPFDNFHGPHLISPPDHRKVHDLTDMHRKAAEYLKPSRRRGTARMATLQSLIDWTNRFKGATSALFLDPSAENPSLTAIADYHASGPAGDGTNPEETARHCAHRATYSFPLSKEWITWRAISGQALDREAMGQFIEDNAKDFIDPSPALLNPKVAPSEAWEARMIETAQKIQGRFGQHIKLIAMARAFQVHETSNLTVKSNPDTGESTIGFVNEHRDPEGNPIQIPNLFLIAIPVFESGVMYRLPVRFQYRKSGPVIKFCLTVYDPRRAFDDALQEAAQIAQTGTDLPLFAGHPEA